MDSKTREHLFEYQDSRPDVFKPKEKVSAESRDNPLHTVESMKDLIDDLNADATRLSQLGYEYIGSDTKRQPLFSYKKCVFAYPIVVDTVDSERKYGWITLDVSDDHTIQYQETVGGSILETLKEPEMFEMSWLQDVSSSTKVVKSRPMWMYPELFDLPQQEVWPRKTDKKIPQVLVVGDPFQSCDREGTTIVEYEYAEEIIPPYLKFLLEGKKDETSFEKEIAWWFADLYREDMNSLERTYGMHTPQEGNPYKAFVEQCFSLVGQVADRMIHGESMDDLEREFEQLKTLGAALKDGSWTVEDGKNIVGREEVSDELMTFFTYKQEVLSNNGVPEKWKNFTELWNGYLQELDKSWLQKNIPDFERKLSQVQFWLGELPTIKSPERIRVGVQNLNNFYDELIDRYDYQDESTHFLREDRIARAFDREDGEFGYFVPGFPLSFRNQKTIDEGLLRIEQIFKYNEGLYPHLMAEKKRIEQLGIPLSERGMFHYLRELEKAWIRQHFFRKQTQKAVPIHGFFPHDMPPMGEQDRIIALTSVTMHGWNSLDEEGFRTDIIKSLPYLKLGGKYILGPVNQSVYFGKPPSGFDALALSKVLIDLKAQGIIDYEFRKGSREYNDREYYLDENERIDTGIEDDPNILRDDQAAHSLVITRLQ